MVGIGQPDGVGDLLGVDVFVLFPIVELVDEVAHIGGGKIGEVTQRLYDTLTGIQYGRIDAPEGWVVDVP